MLWSEILLLRSIIKIKKKKKTIIEWEKNIKDLKKPKLCYVRRKIF